MKVHYSKWFIIPLQVMGFLSLVLGIWLALLEGAVNMQIVFGAVLSLVGILHWKTPVFTLESDSIALYRPIGLVRKRFPFQSRSEIRIDGNKLFVGKARVRISKWALNRSQWRAFEESIAR